MTQKIKSWLYDRFLPAYCRDDLMEANEKLRAKVAAQARQIEQLNAYIDGMENAMRRQSRVIVNTETPELLIRKIVQEEVTHP